MAILSPYASSSTLPLFLISFSIPYTRLHSTLPSTNHITLSSLQLHPSFLPLPANRKTRPVLSRAAIRPPDSDPPPEKDSIGLSGVVGLVSKFQRRVEIFFAVLLWMSLFFWTCAWDGRNRPDKGSRFRR